MPYAVVLAQLGALDEAAAVAEQVIARFTSLNVRGLLLGLAHETRARVALESRDDTQFAAHAALAAAHHGGGRLRRAADTQSEQRDDSLGSRSSVEEDSSVRSQLTHVFKSCRTSDERVQGGLELMVSDSGALGGFLYALTASGLACCATTGENLPDSQIDSLASAYLESQLHDENETRAHDDTAIEITPQWHSQGSARYVPVLLCHQVDNRLGIGGVVVLQIDNLAQFSYPATLAADLSRLCQEYGDLTFTVL